MPAKACNFIKKTFNTCTLTTQGSTMIRMYAEYFITKALLSVSSLAFTFNTVDMHGLSDNACLESHSKTQT